MEFWKEVVFSFHCTSFTSIPHCLCVCECVCAMVGMFWAHHCAAAYSTPGCITSFSIRAINADTGRI